MKQLKRLTIFSLLLFSGCMPGLKIEESMLEMQHVISIMAFFFVISMFIERAVDVIVSPMRARQKDQKLAAKEQTEKMIKEFNDRLAAIRTDPNLYGTEQADKETATIEQKIEAARNKLALDQQDVNVVRGGTRILAFTVALVLSFCVTAAGVRVINSFMDYEKSIQSHFQTNQQSLVKMKQVKGITAESAVPLALAQDDMAKEYLSATEDEKDKKIKQLEDLEKQLDGQLTFLRFTDILLSALLLAGGSVFFNNFTKSLQAFLDANKKKQQQQIS